ncbi:MAG: M81 family metallopeptidase [Geminicoccaceae bacterium]
MRIALLNIGQNQRLQSTADHAGRSPPFGPLYEGQEMMEKLRPGEVGGYIEAVEESGLECTRPSRSSAKPGLGRAGRLDDTTRLFFEEKIRAGSLPPARSTVSPSSARRLLADGMDDVVRGLQLALCREILGPDVPIVLSLDHHANVTRQMIENVDAVVGHRTQPHQPFDASARSRQDPPAHAAG